METGFEELLVNCEIDTLHIVSHVMFTTKDILGFLVAATLACYWSVAGFHPLVEIWLREES